MYINKLCKTTLLFAALALLTTGCSLTCNGNKKSWNECTKSSNWTGKNASKRMMNILSPHMPDGVFEERLAFIKGRGCNSVHLILCNKADGEYGGYSIYGNGITWIVNKSYTDKMTSRIKRLRKEGFGIVLWLMTDDDGGWNKALSANFSTYVNDIKKLGWFDCASIVVLGLELDEYWTAEQVAFGMRDLREKYSGKTGVHMTSGKWDWVQVADILFYQTEPGKTAQQIKSETAKIVANCNGKPVCFFELSRTEDRDLSNAAFAGGAYSVGNW